MHHSVAGFAQNGPGTPASGSGAGDQVMNSIDFNLSLAKFTLHRTIIQKKNRRLLRPLLFDFNQLPHIKFNNI